MKLVGQSEEGPCLGGKEGDSKNAKAESHVLSAAQSVKGPPDGTILQELS